MNAGLDDDDSDAVECKALHMLQSGMPLRAVGVTMSLRGECELSDMHRINDFLTAWVESMRKKL